MQKIKSMLDAFDAKYPQWDHIVADFLASDRDEPETIYQELMDEFGEILISTVDIAKDNDLTIDDLSGIFQTYECWDFIHKYIFVKLDSFCQYVSLRKIAEEDIYKAKHCVDLIWASYIVRFDPHLVFDDGIPMDENGFKDVSAQLDRFVDRCVSRQLSKSAVVIDLVEESHLPQVLCEYIADKFEMDYNQIRMNYIIYRLSSCEKAIKELTEKCSDLD